MSEGKTDNVIEMRDTIERLSKDKAGLTTDVETRDKQLRVYQAQDAFRDQGLNPNHGKLYAAVHPEGEITAETVVEFATEQALTPVSSTQEDPAGEGDSTSSDAADQANLGSMSGSGSRAGDGGAGGSESQQLTRQEYQALYAQDPAAARAAVASGRVEVDPDNPYVRDRIGATRGSNPYANLASPESG